MSKKVQQFRQASSALANEIGLIGQIIVNLTNNSLHVMDGAKEGGYELGRADASNIQLASSSQIGVINSTTFDKIHSDFSTGTKAVFPQATAPTNWTIDTTHNNKALRIVSSGHTSGGNDNFTTVFGSGKTTAGHTLTLAQVPAHTHADGTLVTNSQLGSHNHGVGTLATASDGTHTHNSDLYNTGDPVGYDPGPNVAINDTAIFQNRATSSAGAHTHGLTGNTASTNLAHSHDVTGETGSAGSGNAHSHGLTLDLQFVDALICTRD